MCRPIIIQPLKVVEQILQSLIRADGEVGQISLERSDVSLVPAGTPIRVTANAPARTWNGRYPHGPLGARGDESDIWSIHQLFEKAEPLLGAERAYDLNRYAQGLMAKGLPVIFTLGHLSRIVGIDYQFLHRTVSRRREKSNYRVFPIKKASGGQRYIHIPTRRLLATQQYLNHALLQKVPPHASAFAFHSGGGIRDCAARHCGARWLFQFDLQDFFHQVTEHDVFRIFKSLGYRRLLSFELARICTTIKPPSDLGINDPRFYPTERGSGVYPGAHGRGEFGVLPQGAPTSPMLSNLAASTMDQHLFQFAASYGLEYTRYADDITLSTYRIPCGMSVGRIVKAVADIIRQCGFLENESKRRVCGPGSRKSVLGLLVDGQHPRISKAMYKRIERFLYGATKFGLKAAAAHEGFDSAFGFYNHVSGLISYVKDVDKKRWEEFYKKLSNIRVPWT